MKTICQYCKRRFEIQTGHFNRAMKAGLKVYCNQKCSGLGRRVNKTAEQKKKEKAEYDKEYRRLNEEIIKEQKRQYFKKDYTANPKKYKAIRRKLKEMHNEYCRSPKYKKWKQEYDIKHLAKKHYNDFWEAAIILRKIDLLIDRYEARSQKGTHNKIKKRKQIQSWKSNLLQRI